MLEIPDLHRPFIEWMHAQGIPFVNSRSDRESTIEEGHPDFTLIMGNRVLLIEFKTEKGALRPAQVRRKAVLEAAGNIVHVVRDLGVAITLVTEWRSMLGPVPAANAPRRRGGAEERIFGHAVVEIHGGEMRQIRPASEEDKLRLTRV